MTYLNPGDSALIFAPTFGEYAAACRIQGVEPDTLPPAAPGFRWDLPSENPSVRPPFAYGKGVAAALNNQRLHPYRLMVPVMERAIDLEQQRIA